MYHKLLENLLKKQCSSVVQDQFGKTPLHDAAAKGNLNLIKQLLSSVVDIDLSDHIFKSPLHLDLTIKRNIFNKAKYANAQLLTFVNQYDNEGKTALYYASKNECWESASILLLHGAEDNNLTRDDKKKLLSFLAQKTHGFYEDQNQPFRPIVGFLAIQVPEAVNNFSDDYEYPRLLSYFFAYGHTKVIDALLSSIQDPERRKRIANQTDNGCKPYKRFIRKDCFNDADYLQVIRYFFEKGKVQGIAIDEQEAREILFYAGIQGHLQTFRYLIEQGKVKITNEYDNSSLVIQVSKKNHRNIINYLWKIYREKPLNKEGSTLLHVIAASGNVSIVRYLYSQVATLAIQANNQIHLDNAATTSKGSIEQGIGCNLPDISGKTALNYAIDCEQWEMVAYLLKKNATACHSLLLYNITKFFKNPAQNRFPLHSAIRTRNKSLPWIRFLLDQGIDINSVDEEQRTPLHWIAESTCLNTEVKIVESLLQSGARYDAIDGFYKTPLDLLIQATFISVLKTKWLLQLLNKLFSSQDLMKDLKEQLLREKNQIKKTGPYESWYPDAHDSGNPMCFIINVRNNQGETLLHKAADMNSKEAMACLFEFNRSYIALKKHDRNDYLRFYKPLNINALDDEGNTPLHRAAEHGAVELVNLLLKEGAIFNLKNEKKNTPKALAKRRKHAVVFERLQATEDLFAAVKQGLPVTQTINKLAYIHARDAEGKTLLHYIAEQPSVFRSQPANESVFFQFPENRPLALEKANLPIHTRAVSH